MVTLTVAQWAKERADQWAVKKADQWAVKRAAL
jgi:hypothetical protein